MDEPCVCVREKMLCLLNKGWQIWDTAGGGVSWRRRFTGDWYQWEIIAVLFQSFFFILKWFPAVNLQNHFFISLSSPPSKAKLNRIIPTTRLTHKTDVTQTFSFVQKQLRQHVSQKTPEILCPQASLYSQAQDQMHVVMRPFAKLRMFWICFPLVAWSQSLLHAGSPNLLQFWTKCEYVVSHLSVFIATISISSFVVLDSVL